MIRASELDTITDRILLDAQRAANRGDWGVALAGADEALKNEPKRAEAMFLAAASMRHFGQEGLAALVLHSAATLEPNRPAIWTQLAMCMHERHPKEAYRYALKALSMSPTSLDTLSLLCNLASILGRHSEALDWAEQATKNHGVHAEVCHNKSFALMALGRWKEGWREFKPSLGMPNRRRRNYHRDRETPRWNPDKHENATVVIYGEQGIGDEVMYASMIPMAIEAAEAKGSRVVIECYARNRALFADSFHAPVYGTLRDDAAEWPVDVGVTHKLEMGGLGEFFAPEPFQLDRYLSADPARVAAWQSWFASHNPDRRPLVGIAWTGGSWETGRDRRSLNFEQVTQLMRGQACRFVNLEYEDRRGDLELTPEVLDPYWATAKGGDQAELAAILVNLNLVISVQTSVVDMAGALGVPCWAMADASPQWRYSPFFGGDTMGFYESVRVFRQKEWGEWAPTINRVAHELRAHTATVSA